MLNKKIFKRGCSDARKLLLGVCLPTTPQN